MSERTKEQETSEKGSEYKEWRRYESAKARMDQEEYAKGVKDEGKRGEEGRD